MADIYRTYLSESGESYAARIEAAKQSIQKMSAEMRSQVTFFVPASNHTVAIAEISSWLRSVGFKVVAQDGQIPPKPGNGGSALELGAIVDAAFTLQLLDGVTPECCG